MSKLRPLLTLPILLVLAACSSAGGPHGTPTASTSPGSSPSVSPGGATVDHASGPIDLVLRMETSGGFVPPGIIATQAPSFSLYGDGTLVARDDTAPWPDPAPGGVATVPPFFTTKLSEEQVQGLLRYALGEGGLGIARRSYEAGGVADAPSTIFTVRAGGLDKTVTINALGFDGQEGPDTEIRKAFAALADRLHATAADLSASADAYAPERWRGVLLEGGMGQGMAPLAWPWSDLAPTAFGPAVPGGGFASHVLTAEQVALLELGDPGGGVQDVPLLAPDGTTTYSLALRPLFPDEQG